MSKLPTIRYSHNWNNKLMCPIHTTLRLWNPKIYFRGAKFEEIFNGVLMGTVLVVDVKRLKLVQVNDFIAGLDTGYLSAECQEMIKTMYKNKVSDWETQDLALMLLRRIDPA